MLKRLIGEDIKLQTVLDPQLGNIRADPGQIEQVIMNLVINARDAMPDGGRLTVETANVTLDEQYTSNHVSVVPGDYILLTVSDTGFGMSDEVQARIFDPFFTTKGIDKGTGLGLSMVYGIVKQSGGNIWVYSEESHGSSFKIYLPRVDESVQQYSRGDEASDTPRGNETILIAEDEESVRKLAVQVLELQGYTVLVAPNGGAALLICERHEGPIDLLITDIVMPELGGIELSGRLAALRPNMKVMYMSGYTNNAMPGQVALEVGPRFIQKPFTPDSLARRVRVILDSREPGIEEN